jgi:hypothetical protein
MTVDEKHQTVVRFVALLAVGASMLLFTPSVSSDCLDGRCDIFCGLKKPPIGCGPEAICVCEDRMACKNCRWVYTNCN